MSGCVRCSFWTGVPDLCAWVNIQSSADFFSSLFILSAQQDSMKKANMKRENKAYSFKEQIIELELKEVS